MARIMGSVGLIVVVWVALGCGGGSAGFQTPPTQSPPQSPPPPSPSVSIGSISPSSAAAGSPDVTVTISGTLLTPHPHNVRRPVWSANGTETGLAATSVSDTQLNAVVPAALLAAPVTAQVFIEYGDPMSDTGLQKSNPVSFRVTTAGSVAPASVTLGPKSSQQFTANMNGSSSVTWSVEEGPSGGVINASGLYTPNELGTFHVVATSTADSTQMATAVVSVVAAGFEETGSMHSARSGHTATLLKDGRVLIAGGGDGSAELYDPLGGTFSLIGPPVTRRLDASATLLADGRVLIAGGLEVTVPAPGNPLPKLNTAEIFDPATGQFTPTGNMLDRRWKHTATLLDDGKVLIAGGDGDGFCTIATTELFDPVTGTFSATGSLLSPDGRVGHTATLLGTKEVLIAGGSNGCAPDAADDPPWDPLFVELYEPASGNFQEGGNMSTTRIGHAAILLADGKVLIFGGIPDVQNLLEQPPNPAYAERYDPVAHTFSSMADISITQKDYTATLLSSGAILIAGGDSVGNITSAAELLDPNTGALVTTGSLVHARKGATATLLEDGRVLITGGISDQGNDLASAEIYK